jgi:brefeldin A-resistance guanine nucleotide exchange factor 1
LRALLTSFRLPGEAQIIERIVETFAQHWHTTYTGRGLFWKKSKKRKRVAFRLAQHPSALLLLPCLPTGDDTVKNTDAAFILSYAIILLNVDQHNPKNKRPMTLKDFLRNQRGLNEKEDFPHEFLERIYNNIKSREIVMPDEHDGELKVRRGEQPTAFYKGRRRLATDAVGPTLFPRRAISGSRLYFARASQHLAF